MRTSSLYVTASLLGAVASSCASPECRKDEYRLADTCYRRVRPDAGAGCDASPCSESNSATSERIDGGASEKDAAVALEPDRNDASLLTASDATPSGTSSLPAQAADAATSDDQSGAPTSAADASVASMADGSVPTNSCPPNACNPGGKCISAVGDWSCECSAGYSGTGSKGCSDIDVCAGPTVCDHPSWPCAETTGGGYTCLGRFAEWPIIDNTVPGSAQPNFTVTEATVTDNVTGLIWQRQLPATYPGCTCDGACGMSSPNRRCSHPEARAYCEGLMLDGATDWRLPGVIELVSTFDYAKFTEINFGVVDPQIFSPPPGLSTYQPFESWKTSDVRWRIDLGIGHIGYLVTPSDGGGGLVRCVRSPKLDNRIDEPTRPESRFAVNTSSDTVTDRWTTLQWTRRTSPDALNWGGARIYCRNLGMDLPSPKQLLSLVDPARVPTIDATIFSDTPKADFWTLLKFPTIPDTEVAGNLYWAVNFENGSSATRSELDKLHVRCVR